MPDFVERLEAQAAARRARREADDLARARQAQTVIRGHLGGGLPTRGQLAAMGMPDELLAEFDQVMAGLGEIAGWDLSEGRADG